MPADKLLICDFDDERLFANKVFDYEISGKVSHTYQPLCFLRKFFQKYNFELVTPDVFLSQNNALRGKSFLYSHLQTRYTEKLIKRGAYPLILACQESPYIATRFYVDLPKISSVFKHSFVFSGMEKRLSTQTRYHQMFFPESFDINSLEHIQFHDKKLAVLMNSNKRIGSWKKNLAIKFLYGWDVREIYSERYKVINFFSPLSALELYGPGWDKGGKARSETENISRIYRGFAVDKRQKLKEYKFVFAFENAVFSGYITEKIFDAMFAGCVPIYLGAPDIDKYIPRDCFIDYRNFSNLSDLYQFLSNMDEIRYGDYISNIKKYLLSESYRKFTQEAFAEELLDILMKE